jgi:hypothetical protein
VPGKDTDTLPFVPVSCVTGMSCVHVDPPRKQQQAGDGLGDGDMDAVLVTELLLDAEADAVPVACAEGVGLLEGATATPCVSQQAASAVVPAVSRVRLQGSSYNFLLLTTTQFSSRSPLGSLVAHSAWPRLANK